MTVDKAALVNRKKHLLFIQSALNTINDRVLMEERMLCVIHDIKCRILAVSLFGEFLVVFSDEKVQFYKQSPIDWTLFWTEEYFWNEGVSFTSVDNIFCVSPTVDEFGVESALTLFNLSSKTKFEFSFDTIKTTQCAISATRQRNVLTVCLAFPTMILNVHIDILAMQIIETEFMTVNERNCLSLIGKYLFYSNGFISCQNYKFVEFPFEKLQVLDVKEEIGDIFLCVLDGNMIVASYDHCWTTFNTQIRLSRISVGSLFIVGFDECDLVFVDYNTLEEVGRVSDFDIFHEYSVVQSKSRLIVFSEKEIKTFIINAV